MLPTRAQVALRRNHDAAAEALCKMFTELLSSACIGHLLRQVIQDPSPVRRDLHGRVLEEPLTGG
ncbi:hypothetical protein [Streptosporangium minutum]|nr:hypothetical protein [Streptosporangium minutum]